MSSGAFRWRSRNCGWFVEWFTGIRRLAPESRSGIEAHILRLLPFEVFSSQPSAFSVLASSRRVFAIPVGPSSTESAPSDQEQMYFGLRGLVSSRHDYSRRHR